MDAATGKLTAIRQGRQPLVSPDGKSILFRQADSGLWHTCNLDGTGVRKYGDGLKEYGRPSLSPDGKRLLMQRGAEGLQPRPFVLDFGTIPARPPSRARAAALPVWR